MVSGNGVRVIAGRISPNGTIITNPTGGIRSSSKKSKGLYLVHFKQHFQSPPTAVITVYQPGGTDFSIMGDSTQINALVVSIDCDQMLVKTGDVEGTASDQEFAFIALEQLAV
ncbi:hypothetical protein [Spartinivicinus poritis]|uniref:Uncharacterized protein n=1 Tax=Spartinivicinus poritis TaxID=2994640 RepID=A0ABT5U963_9GAMM|nr:hypothetical protein [Spartinivicinus sp. A2-2]MDE1462908.1 hypothetical protein [Spartinivicinus sp. A2-2]